MDTPFSNSRSSVFSHPFLYRRETFRDGERVHVEDCTAYVMQPHHAARVVKGWNRQGADPSPITGLSYRFGLLDEITEREAAKLRAVCEFTKLTGRPPSGWEVLRMGAAIESGLAPEEAARDEIETERPGD